MVGSATADASAKREQPSEQRAAEQPGAATFMEQHGPK